MDAANTRHFDRGPTLLGVDEVVVVEVVLRAVEAVLPPVEVVRPPVAVVLTPLPLHIRCVPANAHATPPRKYRLEQDVPVGQRPERNMLAL